MSVLNRKILSAEALTNSSESSSQTEEQSFNFSELIQQLRETRVKSTNQPEINVERKTKNGVNIVRDDKERRKENYENGGEGVGTEDESEIELSWRPLDELALKKKYFDERKTCFRPMDSGSNYEVRHMESIDKGKETDSTGILGVKSNFKWNFYSSGKTREDRRSMMTNTVSQENDIDFNRAEDLLKSVRSDIKSTKEIVENIDDYIRVRVDDGLKGIGYNKNDEIPGSFQDRKSTEDKNFERTFGQYQFSSTIIEIKWIILSPLKWKAAYFIIYHLLSFSDVNYSLVENCHNIANNPEFLTINEVDRLIGCHIVFHLLSRYFEEITVSLREIFKCTYQYLVFYGDLHPMLRNGWKETFLYGILNAFFVVLGATILNFYWIPTKNSSPIYWCLWEIVLGSSQKFGIAILLLTLYVDSIQKGLNSFRKELNQLPSTRSRDTKKRSNVDENININQSSDSVYFETEDTNILLESTPSYLTKYSFQQSPLLRKSYNLNQEKYLNVLSVSSINDEPHTDNSETNPDQITPISHRFYTIPMKIISLFSSFLRAPWQTMKLLFRTKVTEIWRKYLNSTLHNFGCFSS